MESKDTAVDDDDRPAPGSLTEQFAARPEATAGTRAAQRGNAGSWVAVSMIILGFALGACALPTHWLILWILTGVALVVGGIRALTSRIMEQAH
ncbi:hypothetical protein [Pseudofrankia inefficax]|uniref:Uncharacterized protein n=1 Tax=Pseudofrankia inefficax (strain DSM 45817 / CECT 9037 / DDB 130130 / EuI1c) TaxID=298654 RepID=E3J8C5_PSEI1|nr:hypothetical protein [Pseudofrankia inefficax]ADP84459.1 hypothetical protein FraEuI1c_6480 [Pseudofrankia inefficax]